MTAALSTESTTKEKFGREYVFINPEPNGPGTFGTWRLRQDDNATGGGGGGGGGGDANLSFKAIVSNNSPAIEIGHLVRINTSGQVELASAASTATASVAGMAITSADPGTEVEITRNETKDLFNSANLVENNSNGGLEPGKIYFLSTTPGKWTGIPDTTTSGAVVRACGTAVSGSRIAIEIQFATVIS